MQGHGSQCMLYWKAIGCFATNRTAKTAIMIFGNPSPLEVLSSRLQAIIWNESMCFDWLLPMATNICFRYWLWSSFLTYDSSPAFLALCALLVGCCLVSKSVEQLYFSLYVITLYNLPLILMHRLKIQHQWWVGFIRWGKLIQIKKWVLVLFYFYFIILLVLLLLCLLLSQKNTETEIFVGFS